MHLDNRGESYFKFNFKSKRKKSFPVFHGKLFYIIYIIIIIYIFKLKNRREK